MTACSGRPSPLRPPGRYSLLSTFNSPPIALLVIVLAAVLGARRLPPLFASVAAATIGREQLQVDGLRVTLPAGAGESVTIDPLPVLHHEFDGALTRGQPGWRGDFLLPKTAWVYRGLRRGTLSVSVAADPTVKLVEGRDYLLDPDWGSVNAAAGSRFPPGTPLHFAYAYTASRLDLVARRADGKLAVEKGREDMHAPLLPPPASGSTPLFSVYLPHNTTALSPGNLLVIDPGYPGVPPVSDSQALAPLLRKLAGQDPVTIVCFGDSITAQPPADFRDGRGTYVDRLGAALRRRYPRRTVDLVERTDPARPAPGHVLLVRAGVGGNDTRDALERIEADVLSRHPDLAIVMFGVNDENSSPDAEGRPGNEVPLAEYRRNLDEIVHRVRATGAEPLLMTTSMKNPGWTGTAGNLREYAAVARDLAKRQHVCLVDNYEAWRELPRQGYHPLIFLDSCINHPNDLGHELFARGLRAAFGM